MTPRLHVILLRQSLVVESAEEAGVMQDYLTHLESSAKTPRNAG